MQSEEIRKRFLRFFEKRGHTIILSASLVPTNDSSVLFTTAGMHPLVPYLLGEKHPEGKMLANVQKCVRTQDIEEVGDNIHDTFFEMLGNWSLGSYFKEEAIKWSYEFLTDKDEGLGLDKNLLYFTCFEGDENAPRDTESAEIWKSLGIPENRIYFLGAKDNWWSPGPNGPCGPDTEMFYDLTGNLGDLSKEEFVKTTDEQKIVEVWNDVFMEYKKVQGKVVGKLTQKNVDTGAGLERLAMVMQKTNNVFATDLFDPLMKKINSYSDSNNERAKRIVADHIRTAIFMIADGVLPSNTDRGYVLRRLIRRAVRYADIIGLPRGLISVGYEVPILPKGVFLHGLVDAVVEKYKEHYSNLNTEYIRSTISMEEERFRKTLSTGMREFERMANGGISGKEAFVLFSSYGFPFEMTKELAIERGVNIDENEFQEEMREHQIISRAGAEQKFKGGLADTSVQSVKYHTATHLLHTALREVLGDHVFQKGSNITPERMRFDFSFERKMTDEEKKKTEDLVNEKIKEALTVSYEDVSLAEAEKKGAIGLFGEKYGDTVRIYKMGDFSLEFCGGPHVKNTSELGHFKISKEEACSAGIRRIKAVLE